MIADLHAHYPMHLSTEVRGSYLKLVRSRRGRLELLDLARSLAVRVASLVANYRSFDAGPRVTVPLMRAGGYGVALSVLYSPFDEMDLTKPYAAPPDRAYFGALLRQLEMVEAELAREHAETATVARNPAELDAALAAGKVALVHCVEGGFHLGASEEQVERDVTELAQRGVAYVTLAHLFYRQVATNANALPFLPDRLYDLFFPQPESGLAPLGRAAIRAMLRERVIVDLSHASERALADAFALLDELDPRREAPVIASHVACRFGSERYNLTDPAIERIAERDGVVGLILAEHQAADGLRRPRSLGDSLAILFAHCDRIRALTGSHRHTALGTDLDGFIKPTLPGLEDAGAMASVERALRERYGDADGELIASGNALRLLRSYWRGRVDGP